MISVYAKPGESLQQIGGTAPTGWVQMQGQRPSPYHVAQPDGTWARPVAHEAARRLAEINAACEAELAAIRAKYPESEVLSWAKQEDEARRWQAWADEDEPNPAEEPATPLVDMLAAERGMDKAELVGRIIAKADAYTQAVGVAVGKRQRLEDQLDAILAAHQLPPDDPAHLPAEEAAAQMRAVVW